MGCPIRGVILDPIVAMQMGIQGRKLQNELAEGHLTGVAFDRRICHSTNLFWTKKSLVDQNCHPRKHDIDVPSLTSIEAMRTPSFADLLAATNIACENGTKCVENGSKLKHHHQVGTW
ncbi:ATP binding microtubule motor family protein [Artemisia annua]|uniref:ATP binding microtubule motor family protein n=1 Tax=Artemisia annua TaxID=35608 RepID=A0A2U1L944_ARTAN|nr:ATP binding microtubule motor family protein [Artemisia annua]